MDNKTGQTLEEVVQSSGPLPEPQAMNYVRQIASVLSLLHQQGRVHLGVNPRTILCHPEGVALVDAEGGTSPSLAALQSDSVAIRYVPIEQVTLGLNSTPATDIYSLAATLYYVLTGQPPIAASLRSRVPLSALRRLQPSLSLNVEKAIDYGMQIEAQGRPQTLEDWLTLLPEYGADGTSTIKKSVGNYKTLLLGGTPASLSPSSAPNNEAQTLSAPHPPELVLPKLQQPNSGASPKPRAPRSESQAGGVRKKSLGKVLLLTAAISALMGAGFGLAIRAISQRNPIIQPEQSFPMRNDWPGTSGGSSSPSPDSAPSPSPANPN